MNLKHPAISMLLFFVCASSIAADFGSDMNACLARAPQSLEECSRSAAITTDSVHLEIRKEFDPSTGESQREQVQNCGKTGAGETFCEIYECGNDGNQSVCQLVAYCLENSHFKLSHCR